MNNEDRAKSVGVVLQAFAKSSGLSEAEDGPVTIAGDMIANILHWVVQRNPDEHAGRLDALEAVHNGIGHFVAEELAKFEDDIGPDVNVIIKALVQGEKWEARTFLSYPETDRSQRIVPDD